MDCSAHSYAPVEGDRTLLPKPVLMVVVIATAILHTGNSAAAEDSHVQGKLKLELQGCMSATHIL